MADEGRANVQIERSPTRWVGRACLRTPLPKGSPNPSLRKFLNPIGGLRVGSKTSRGRAGRRCPLRKARGGGVADEALRRRRATQRSTAHPPSPSGCGGRPPSPASLLLGVSLRIRPRRRSWDPAAWRSQRGSREVLEPTLSVAGGMEDAPKMQEFWQGECFRPAGKIDLSFFQ